MGEPASSGGDTQPPSSSAASPDRSDSGGSRLSLSRSVAGGPGHNAAWIKAADTNVLGDDGVTETSVIDTEDKDLHAVSSEYGAPVSTDEKLAASRTEMPHTKRTVRQDSSAPAVTHHRLHRFTLYETNARYFIAGADVTDKYFKVLKIDRTSAPGHLNVYEDGIIYSKPELNQLLTAIDDGNKATGGLRHRLSFWGVLGFIRFTESYYMLLITKRAQVAMLGGHYIYQVDGTELIPLTTGPSARFASSRNPEESRFLGIFGNLDLSKNFYYSYTYNITRTLQENIMRERTAAIQGQRKPVRDYNGMFVWNHHLLSPAVYAMSNMYDWCVPITHGFIDQSTINVFGRAIYVTIIGRRSRFFAGARFLKRGVNDLGYVANDVETEQIVSEMLTTSFHAPGPRLFSNPNYTSYVHHRGSIPLYWTQDNAGVSPKPDIDLNLKDPFYQPAALHFDDLFQRYGCPIYVLNLIKARERVPRESKLLSEFKDCIDYLNQFLPADKRIQYKTFDMSRAAKTRGGDVIGTLEKIAAEILEKTDFFVNGNTVDDISHVQNGIARTNCIDCLDRTNAAQFVIGKYAFGLQLQALGVIPTPDMEYDSDAIDIFTHMFHDHGDTIAVQYGGSHLVNTMATYRKMNHWQGHGRDMVESFKRFYHNSFLDSQRQEAYNLFLGNYIYSQGQPMLWDLATDYYLHHSDPRRFLDRNRARRSYIDWFRPESLEVRTLPTALDAASLAVKPLGLTDYDDFWLEYYRPLTLSSFLKIYSFRLAASTRFLADRTVASKERLSADGSGISNFSPFVPRPDPSRPAADSPEKQRVKKGVTIVDPNSETDEKKALRGAAAPHSPPPHKMAHAAAGNSILIHPATPLGSSIGRPHGLLENITSTGSIPDNERVHFRPIRASALPYNASPSPSPLTATSTTTLREADKSAMNQWTLNRIYEASLAPTVSVAEAAEYERYVAHPSTIPLVVSDVVDPSSEAVGVYGEYVASGKVEAFGHEYQDDVHGGWQGRDGVDAHDWHYGGAGEGPVGGAVGAFGLEHGDRSRLRRASDPRAVEDSRRPLSRGGHGSKGARASLAVSFASQQRAADGTDRHNGGDGLTDAAPWGLPEQDLAEFRDFVDLAHRGDPLTVFESDRDKKRYKAYRQWLVKGKSLFKQSKVDPEHKI